MPLKPDGPEPLLQSEAAAAAGDFAGNNPIKTAATDELPARISLGHRLWMIIFALFALELGLILSVYPWTDYWNLNHLPALLIRFLPGGEMGNAAYPNLDDFWDDPAFRSTVTGLGLFDLWIALQAFLAAFRRNVS